MLIDTAPTPSSPAVRRTQIRPLLPGDSLDVRCIVRASIVLGRPINLEYADLVSYERLCIDWYLTEGRSHVRVVEQDGEIIGCLLACLDQTAYDTWFRRRAARWATRAFHRLVTGRLRGDARRFVALRIRDGFSARQAVPLPPFPAHARLYIAGEPESGDVRRRLVTAMDDMVEAAGLPGWCGRIDVPDGQSTQVLERDGFRVVNRTRNRTGSWLLGTPVRRVTLAREPVRHPHRHPGL